MALKSYVTPLVSKLSLKTLKTINGGGYLPDAPTNYRRKELMSDKGISDQQYHQGGYGRFKLTKEFINEAHSRVRDPKTNKVYRGEAGKQLLRRQQEKQAYYERQ